jgi:hypothetical protein
MHFRLERALFLPRPRAEVFAFFSDACNLERITPAFVHFQIFTPAPIPLRAGTLIDYELRLYGIRFQWQTRIESFDPPVSFVDSQVRGPYKLWRHTHTFEEVPGGTQMRDSVDYALPMGAFDAAARWLFVRRSLNKIFDYRNAAIGEIFR